MYFYGLKKNPRKRSDKFLKPPGIDQEVLQLIFETLKFISSFFPTNDHEMQQIPFYYSNDLTKSTSHSIKIPEVGTETAAPPPLPQTQRHNCSSRNNKLLLTFMKAWFGTTNTCVMFRWPQQKPKISSLFFRQKKPKNNFFPLFLLHAFFTSLVFSSYVVVVLVFLRVKWGKLVAVRKHDADPTSRHIHYS